MADLLGFGLSLEVQSAERLREIVISLHFLRGLHSFPFFFFLVVTVTGSVDNRSVTRTWSGCLYARSC